MPPSRMPKMSVRVCGVHGLAVRPDGKCVLCKRDAPPPSTPWGPLVGGVVIVLAVTGAVIGWKLTRGPRDPGPIAAVVMRPPAAQSPASAPEAATAELVDDSKAQANIVKEQERKRQAELQVRSVRITMYSAKKCDLCDAARDWLKRENYAFSEIDVGSDEAALAAMHKLTPSNEVPVFDVDGEVLVGFGPTNVAGAVHRAADRRAH